MLMEAHTMDTAVVGRPQCSQQPLPHPEMSLHEALNYSLRWPLTALDSHLDCLRWPSNVLDGRLDCLRWPLWGGPSARSSPCQDARLINRNNDVYGFNTQ